MSFQRFVLADVDENYAPPEKPVLDLCVIAGVAFLRIGKQEPEGKRAVGAIKEAAQIAVPVDDLYDALGVAWRGDARARARANAMPQEESR